MRKENMITRTITSTVFRVMCVDVTKSEVVTKEITLSGEGLSDDKVLKMIKDIIDILTGADKNIKALLKSEMEEAAKNLDFEKAARLRDKIFAVPP